MPRQGFSHDVKRVYKPHPTIIMALDPNSRKLRALLEAFDIPLAAVAATCAISRAYVSRVLSPNDPLTGNDAFWIKVERALPRLIELRRGQVFEVGAVPADKVEALKEALAKTGNAPTALQQAG